MDAGLVGEMIILGVLATAIMDAIQYSRYRLFNTPWFDYRLFGRVLILKLNAKNSSNFRSHPPVFGELALGWGLHYFIGVILSISACWLVQVWQINAPIILFFITYGFVTVFLPFFVMQPLMGLGIAASKTPNPWANRLKSCVVHSIFGLSIYIAYLIIG